MLRVYIHYGEAILAVVPSDKYRVLLASERPHNLKIIISENGEHSVICYKVIMLAF